HWVESGSTVSQADFEGIRTDLPVDVPPGGVIDIEALVRGPAEPGDYRLRWDLVQEGVTWFSERGNATPEVPIEVLRGTAPAVPQTAMDRAPVRASDAPAPSRTALWRAAVVLWRQRPILGIGPDNFRRRYEAVLSPAPTGQPYEDDRIHANSLYFETLADLGVAGIAVLAMLGFALVQLARDHAKAGRLLYLACSVGAGSFFVHGALDYFMEFTPLFSLFWVLLGLAAGCVAPPSRSEGRPRTMP
ncbi:MAG TPA: O-antigen ligase family protein, partial [Polyangiaceae bacterium]|nr:O-antigen ligase family protein [Polyangiaceae bacterium]